MLFSPYLRNYKVITEQPKSIGAVESLFTCNAQSQNICVSKFKFEAKSQSNESGPHSFLDGFKCNNIISQATRWFTGLFQSPPKPRKGQCCNTSRKRVRKNRQSICFKRKKRKLRKLKKTNRHNRKKIRSRSKKCRYRKLRNRKCSKNCKLKRRKFVIVLKKKKLILKPKRKSMFRYKHKYYVGEGTPFLRTRFAPPVNRHGYAAFLPSQLAPDFYTAFKRMLNYKFKRAEKRPIQKLERISSMCVRALPDVPAAIEWSKEVTENGLLRPRAFAICGDDLLPKFYAIEFTSPIFNIWNWFSCFSIRRLPLNLAIYGLDGELVMRISSTLNEICPCFRIPQEWCCKSTKIRKTIILNDGTFLGSLHESRYCCLTQNLHIHPGNPAEFDEDNVVVEWQSKCWYFDWLMLCWGCKTHDGEGPMIMYDQEGRKYATARAWEGMSTEDFAFLFSIRFVKSCPVEMRALAIASAFIYNYHNWETKYDADCCDCIGCTFCTLHCWNQGGPMTYDIDNWSNKRTRLPTAFLPCLTVNRPAVVNYRRV